MNFMDLMLREPTVEETTRMAKIIEEDKKGDGKIYSESEMTLWPDDDDEAVKDYFKHEE